MGFFSDLGSGGGGGGGGGGRKKSFEYDQLTGHFQRSFFNISRKNSKTSNVNQQSALNL